MRSGRGRDLSMGSRGASRLPRSLSRNAGFTLIELMVVLLIIGILIAIALPVFLGARVRAQDRSAQANARNAYVVALAYYTDRASFTGFDAPTAQAQEPNVQWVGGVSPTVGQVDIDTATAGSLLLIAPSASGTWWCVRATNGIADKGSGPDMASVQASCTGGW